MLTIIQRGLFLSRKNVAVHKFASDPCFFLKIVKFDVYHVVGFDLCGFCERYSVDLLRCSIGCFGFLVENKSSKVI